MISFLLFRQTIGKNDNIPIQDAVDLLLTFKSNASERPATKNPEGIQVPHDAKIDENVEKLLFANFFYII